MPSCPCARAAVLPRGRTPGLRRRGRPSRREIYGAPITWQLPTGWRHPRSQVSAVERHSRGPAIAVYQDAALAYGGTSLTGGYMTTPILDDVKRATHRGWWALVLPSRPRSTSAHQPRCVARL